jgi:hypothetical protein
MTHASASIGTSPARQWAGCGHIDPAALRALLVSLGGDARVHSRFVRDFVGLWGTRFRRLAIALDRADAEEAHVVLLSIRSSSVMVGAARLEAVATGVHNSLKCGDISGCRGQLSELVEAGAVTCDELAELFPGLRAVC